ncbi:hypothetical protein PsYK624_075640 [Phanerochaete sordida]|uniref:Uncharacterized protein n=1 Tax=Phanerochaete sordida TaxID=48140 RepID=A0A9P3GCN7_9APHY|nr:hypothetical protein PsYK624_075640 [Phanerochaete sordida]
MQCTLFMAPSTEMRAGRACWWPSAQTPRPWQQAHAERHMTSPTPTRPPEALQSRQFLKTPIASAPRPVIPGMRWGARSPVKLRVQRSRCSSQSPGSERRPLASSSRARPATSSLPADADAAE